MSKSNKTNYNNTLLLKHIKESKLFPKNHFSEKNTNLMTFFWVSLSEFFIINKFNIFVGFYNSCFYNWTEIYARDFQKKKQFNNCFNNGNNKLCFTYNDM